MKHFIKRILFSVLMKKNGNIQYMFMSIAFFVEFKCELNEFVKVPFQSNVEY